MIDSVAPPSWQPLLPADADAVHALADTAHPGLPERTEIFAERIRLFPGGCLKLAHAGALAAYGIAHPWHLGSPPPLDTLIGALPADADCLHLHDVVVAAALRGHGASTAYFAAMETVARSLHLGALSLVAVYGSDRLWSRFGYGPHTTPALAAKLAAYGPTARYLVRPL